jgi:tRNA G18 (ribose-2'-O)-methylase SpoU
VRCLFASRFRAESVLVTRNKAEGIAAIAPAGCEVLVAPQEVLNEIVGFRFHTGIVACGVRADWGALRENLPAGAARALLVVCPEIANGENLGGLIRLSATFGATAMLLGERCHDPWARQPIRVSMGQIFSLPIVQSTDIVKDMQELSELGFTRVATVVDDQTAVDLAHFDAPARAAVVFGNEAQGISNHHLALCDARVTIPMRGEGDSLNVAVAAGIILHHFTCVK